VRAFSCSAQSNSHPVSSSNFSGSLATDVYYLLFMEKLTKLLWNIGAL
jgi:hypothetical protein